MVFLRKCQPSPFSLKYENGLFYYPVSWLHFLYQQIRYKEYEITDGLRLSTENPRKYFYICCVLRTYTNTRSNIIAGVYELNYERKTILCMDIAGLQSKDIIRKQPPKSLLVITNVTDAGFDTKVANIIKEYAQHNTPYVKASAVVGISGWQKIILTTVKALTGRDFYITDTMEKAQEWLIKQ